VDAMTCQETMRAETEPTLVDNVR